MRYFVLIVLLVTQNVIAETKTEFFKDRAGRPIGSATTIGRNTYYQNKSGKTVLSKTQFGRFSFYKDSAGRSVGSKTKLK